MATRCLETLANYKIFAKTVIFSNPPSVEQGHPYTSAVLKHWKNTHKDLPSTFAVAKIIFALKKLKLSQSVAVKMYNLSQNNIFGDNSR